MSTPSFQEKLRRKIEHVDPIKKQRVIAHKQAGMKLGQICKQVDLELLVVSGIIYEHIATSKLFGERHGESR